ncbi:hybrid sensor histidine kinase/response regulator transcription factor [Marinifilum caeruleilacunae]|uniref:histidine kinase n=1 Tax=Marinifilum caeruleilacunae TaxID=2499076 RepID=A0ABX1WZB4_9BACT|nr:hybrid sensor histidine kinase/response regulator transcription factor [Marinifilum caeruleilacunae]NOU61311.1 hybrid sensor histidine kinase/response regulator [Marinifilum caeruleilacunae]
MIQLRTFLLLLLLITFNSNTYSQNVKFDHFDISNELSQNNIIDLIVDDIGYVWVGTLEGLNRFDGYKFKVFKSFPKKNGNISGSEIVSLGKSINGNIWVITKNGGLNYFNHKFERFETFPFSLFKNFNIENVNSIVEISPDEIWIAEENMLGVFNKSTLNFSYKKLPFSIDCMIKLPNSKLLMSGENGIYEANRVQVTADSCSIELDKLYSNPVYKLAVNNDSTIIGITKTKILQWKNIKNIPQTLFSFSDVNLPNVSFNNLIRDVIVKENDIWIGGDYPLVKININKEIKVSIYKNEKDNPSSFKGHVARKLAFDKNNNLWIGTTKHGINLLEKKKNQFKHYHLKETPENAMNFDPVRCICKTRSGDLWFALDRFGVGVQHPNGEQELYLHFYEQNKVRDLRRVRSIFEDSAGNIWVGDSNGMGIFNPYSDRIESIHFKYGWEWPYLCYSIKEFENGLLTLTGKPNLIGVINLKTNNLNTFPFSKNNVSLSGTIRDITQDRYHNTWVGSNKGIIKISYPDFNYSKIDYNSNGILGNKVYSIHSKGDSLWIGTNNGLGIFSISQNKTVKTFLEDDGLVDNIIYSIYSDSKNKVWISTNNGISCFNEEHQKFTNYLENNYFMDDAHFQHKNGELFYGGYNGIVSFKPEEVAPEQNIGKPFYEKLYLFNKLVNPLDTIDNNIILKNSLSQTNQISLTYRQNSLSISFNAFPYSYPNSNRFRYKLIGFQENWSYSMGTNSLVTYTSLPPGNYELHLCVSSDNQYWSEAKILSIEIIPPIWKQFWFKIAVIALLLLLAVLFYFRRIANIKKHNLILKKRVEEQTSELRRQKNEIEEIAEKLHEADEAKLRFFTNISHEFRTPLTLILGHLDQSNGKLKHSNSKAIKNNALRLLMLVNQLIDIRKVDQNQMQLSINQIDIVNLTKEIVESFQVVANKKNIDLQFLSTSKNISMWLDVDKMNKILYNLISNAIKYTPKNKWIVVSIADQYEHIELTVSDKGIGIPSEDIEYIFDRFYRGKGKNIEGHGIGLSLVKNLVEIQKGAISVKSMIHKGSEFKLIFKKGKGHFSPDNIVTDSYQQFETEKYEDIQEEWQPFNPGVDLMVVEDNIDLSDFLKSILSKYYNVITATNGKEAIELLKNNTPELIISDIMMPEMDGITFCKYLKQNIYTSHIPIILLTAKNSLDTKFESFELGIDGFIEKPFNAKLLLLRINAILENRERFKRQYIEHGSQIESIKNKPSSTDKLFWSRITGIIDTNYSLPEFSVDEMSIKMNMSRASFYRKFKGLTGISPGDYLRKCRLKKAHTMLLEDNISISKVSLEVGFQSVSHFRKCFKEEYGSTPSEYRKTNS